MTTEALLTLLTVMVGIMMVAIVVMVMVLVRVVGRFGQLGDRVDNTLAMVESEAEPTLREVRAMVGGFSKLTAAAVRLLEEMAKGYAARRASPAAAGSKSGRSRALHTGLDLALRAVDLWKSMQAERQADPGEKMPDGKRS